MINLKILFVEDLAADVEIAVREIRKETIRFDFQVVDSPDAFLEALVEFDPDLIISDYAMPVFDGMSALTITRTQPRYIPFIMLTGSMNEETAVACMKAGADDYVLKEKIKRLPFAVLEVMEKQKIDAERERVLQQLRESEERLREIAGKLTESNRQKELILNSTTEIFAYYDLNLRVIWANQASARSVGRSLEEIQGLPCYQLWQNRTEPCENCVVIKALETGEPQLGEQVTPDGRHWQLRGYPVLNEQGKVVALVELGMDITAQKNAEEARATSEETYRNLFQNAQVGLFRTRISDGKILEGNDQIARMFGYGSREEFIADYITSEDYVDPGTRESMLELIKSQGFVENFKARFYRKDSSVFYSSYSARINPEKGWIEGVVEEITEREQALQALNRASENWKITFRSMKDGIALLDADQHILQSNAMFQEFVGRTEEELKDTRCFMHIHGTDCPINGCPFVKMKESRNRETMEMLINGRVCEIIVDPILNDAGEIAGAVHVLTDITQRKQMISDLIDAKERAEESDRLKSAFLANMSHEIRTPMNGIMGFTELLKEPNLSGEEQQRFIEIIRKSGDRLLNTVNDLIDISRIETGQMPMSYDDVPVNSLLEGLVSFFLPQTEQKGLQLILDETPGFSYPTIYTDQIKLESILINLIKNAIKYTETGEIRISCQVEGEVLKFRIEDTGIGVPDDRKEAIFNRFEQADISDTRAFQGSGLGLSIAKAYVEMLGGEIGVESTEGIGSTFWFTIPYVVVPEIQPEERTDSGQIPKPEAVRPGKKRKILVAEDDEDSYFYLSVLLSESALELMRTTTGTETVALCRIHPDIDLILMDIKMPMMDGFEATRQIREFNKEVIIIAQTAYALTGDREKALEAGCNDYVTKPVNKNRLVTMLSKHLSGNIP